MGYIQAPGVISGRSQFALSCFLLWDIQVKESEGCQMSTHNWRLQKPYKVNKLIQGRGNSASMCKHLSKYNNIHRRISLMRCFTCRVTMTWQWSHYYYTGNNHGMVMMIFTVAHTATLLPVTHCNSCYRVPLQLDRCIIIAIQSNVLHS